MRVGVSVVGWVVGWGHGVDVPVTAAPLADELARLLTTPVSLN